MPLGHTLVKSYIQFIKQVSLNDPSSFVSILLSRMPIDIVGPVTQEVLLKAVLTGPIALFEDVGPSEEAQMRL